MPCWYLIGRLAWAEKVIYTTANLFLGQAAAWSLLDLVWASLNPKSRAEKKHSAGYAVWSFR